MGIASRDVPRLDREFAQKRRRAKRKKLTRASRRARLRVKAVAYSADHYPL